MKYLQSFFTYNLVLMAPYIIITQVFFHKCIPIYEYMQFFIIFRNIIHIKTIKVYINAIHLIK